MAKAKLFSHTTLTQINIEDCAKGEFIRRNETTTKTWNVHEYDRSQKRYCIQDEQDHCHYMYLKKGTKVWVGFEY